MLTEEFLVLCLVIPALAGLLANRQTLSLESYPGYIASNVKYDGSKITADLALAGTACSLYGNDLHDLKLEFEYQTGMLMMIWSKPSYLPAIRY